MMGDAMAVLQTIHATRDLKELEIWASRLQDRVEIAIDEFVVIVFCLTCRIVTPICDGEGRSLSFCTRK